MSCRARGRAAPLRRLPRRHTRLTHCLSRAFSAPLACVAFVGRTLLLADDLDEDESDGSGELLESEEEEEDVGKEVQVDFEFFDPRAGDYHALKLLMRGFCGGGDSVDAGALADAAEAQPEVGTVVRGGEASEGAAAAKGAADGDVCAFATALGFGAHKAAVKSAIKVLKACAHPKDACRVDELVASGDKAALLLCQRAAGLPFAVATNLLRSLFEDVDWAARNADSGSKRFSFQKFLHAAPCWRLGGEAGAEGSGAGGKGGGKKKGKKKGKSLDFARWEDRALLQAAEWHFVADGHHEGGEEAAPAEGATPAMCVMCVPLSAREQLLDSLPALEAEQAEL